MKATPLLSLKISDWLFFFSDECFGRAIIEVKKSLQNPMVEDQAVSQTVVFSFIQEKKYPLTHSFVPNILISPNEFRVIMYDATNDILICSQPLYIFKGKSLNESAIIILWMVLHYGLFLKKESSPFKNGDTKFKHLKALFDKKTPWAYLNWYQNNLQIGTTRFPVEKKNVFPSLEMFSNSADVFQTT